MLRLTWLAIAMMMISACASAPKSMGSRRPAAAGDLLDASDPRLIDHSDDPMTVWKAIEMAKTEDGRTKLDQLFDESSVSLSSLPGGYSAGQGTPMPNLPSGLDKLLSALTGDNWRGKIFCTGTANETHGLNRIRREPLTTSASVPIVPMGAFKTSLIAPDDKRNLATTAKTNLVILNYSNPITDGQHPGKNYWVEHLLAQKHLSVYDVMVAVPGKYGPVYLGKTWLGSYDANGDFHAEWNFLIARYYLDFNPGALAEQKAQHWPAGEPELPVSVKNDCQGVTLP